jgi:hypothetical protein
MIPVWALPSTPPAREVRAREALEIAVKQGVNITEVLAACGLPEVFAWSTLTDAKLAEVSGRLRIAAGFYD